MKNMQVRIRRMPNGAVAPEDFELVESDAPSPGRGEMLARTKWLALDAHAFRPRGRGHTFHAPRAGDVVAARAVCEILDSRNEIFNTGDLVVMNTGLQQYVVAQAQGVHRVKTGSAPASAALGIMGTPGLLAYCGLLDIARITAGKTVVAAAAACISGAMAGHVARIKSCRTIGVARTAPEAAWCMREGHFGDCIDLRSESLDERLRALAPKGVDVCFDGEGGDIAKVVLNGHRARGHLAPGGQVVVANLASGPPSDDPNVRTVMRSVEIEEFEHRHEAFLKDAIAWFAEGHLRYHEDTVAGLQHAPEQMCRVMRGQAFGQALVRN